MPDPINLGYAIGLAPEKAIEYFRSKGYAISWNWQEVWQEMQSRVFTVAKVTDLELLQDISRLMDAAIAGGQTFAEFEANLTPVLQAAGWWGEVESLDADTGEVRNVQLGSPRRIRTIYETNMQTALQAGRYRDQVANVAERPYWQYVAIMDDRTRPSHAALNGRVLPADDPAWNYIYPPCGFNCRCRVRALSRQNLEDRGLSASSSEGHLQVIEREDRGGSKWEQAVLKLPGMDRAFAPDKGWSYNPGKEGFKPSLGSYETDLANAYRQAAGHRPKE